MKLIEPQVFLLGEMKIDQEQLNFYLNEINASDWKSDASTDSELLCEIAGRACYRSWKPGLNPNIKKVRKSNEEYLEHVIGIGHGSILEHATLNFILHNVSRVFTHELVRHRVGVAYSQESLRFVRLDKIHFWMPFIFKQHPKSQELIKLITETVEFLEEQQLRLAEIIDIDNEKDFSVKKKLTSAMRRIAPLGLATTIVWSVNFRTLRHVIERRTDFSAEEEIRLIIGKVAEIVQKRYPNVFADYQIEVVDDLPWYKTKHQKI